MFKVGDRVQFRQYCGIVHFMYRNTKTYSVTFPYYRGMYNIDRECKEIELKPIS